MQSEITLVLRLGFYETKIYRHALRCHTSSGGRFQNEERYDNVLFSTIKQSTLMRLASLLGMLQFLLTFLQVLLKNPPV